MKRLPDELDATSAPSGAAQLKREQHLIVTSHAIARFRSRIDPHMTEPEARAYLEEQWMRAHRVKTLASGVEQWRGPKPLRMRMRVHRGALITVLPSSDTWRAPRGTIAPWQREPKEARAANPAAGRREEEETGLAAAGSALRPEDLVHAKFAKFGERVERALDVIRRAAEIGGVGVSFSGGKDSTVSLDLVRRVLPDAPAAFFDSGAELDGTREMVDALGAETVHPRLTMLDMARYAGWWGYVAPVDPDCEFDAKQVLINDPCETFVVKRRLRVMVHGVRSEESHARSMHVASRGELYRGRDGTWYCMPLARWSLADVWAYIASRGLRYHRVYDVLSAAGIPRESQRVSGALGERGSGFGRHAALRLAEPETWRRLAVEFPALSLW